MRPLSPIDPTVLPDLRSMIQTLSLAPSATKTYFCCGSAEKARLKTVPQGPYLSLPGPPHSAPRAGVDGCTQNCVTNLPCLVNTCTRSLPRSQTYTNPSFEMWMQCSTTKSSMSGG